jgi:hypothetical protein
MPLDTVDTNRIRGALKELSGQTEQLRGLL